MSLERWARAAGVGFVVLFVVGFFVAGEAPGLTDPAEEVVAYFDGDRGMILAGAVIWAIGWGLLLWFASAISNVLREGGEGGAAAITLAAATAFVGLQLVVVAITAALAHTLAPSGDSGAVTSVYAIGWSIDVIAAVAFGVFVVASSVGLTRIGVLPSWFAPAGIVVGAIMVLRATNWANDGFWSPSGGYIFVVMIAGLVWIVATSVVLFRAAPRTEMTKRAAPTPA